MGNFHHYSTWHVHTSLQLKVFNLHYMKLSFLIILNQTLIMYRINRKGYYKRKATKIPRPFTNASFKGNNDIWCHTRANVTKHIPSLIITPNFLWTFSVKTYIRVKPHKMVYSMWDTNTHGKIVSCYYVKYYFICG